MDLKKKSIIDKYKSRLVVKEFDVYLTQQNLRERNRGRRV